MKTGIELIAEERQRQINVEGWTKEHDAKHDDGELANAAAYYALTDELISFMDADWGNDMHLHIWPFDLKWLKRNPENRIRDLQKAGALIAAEIDRLNHFNVQNKDSKTTTVKSVSFQYAEGVTQWINKQKEHGIYINIISIASAGRYSEGFVVFYEENVAIN